MNEMLPVHPPYTEKLPEDANFERQFNTRAEIDVGAPSFDTASVCDVRPERWSGELPILFVTGFKSTITDYQVAIEQLYHKGQRVISIDYPQDNGPLEMSDEKAPFVRDHSEYPEGNLRKAATLLKVLDRKGIAKVDIIAHSAGAVDAGLAALLQPNKIRSITFFCPAGFVNTGYHETLANRIKQARDLSGRFLDYYSSQSHTPWWKTIFKEGSLQALADGLGILKANIHTLIEQLHQAGVELYVLIGENDPIFKADEVAQALQEDVRLGLVHTPIRIPDSGHGKGFFDAYMDAYTKKILRDLASKPPYISEKQENDERISA
jgi:pimeloyl-ACP methyl ester carboxylesterase